MPQVHMTQAQREQAALDKMIDTISDAVLVQKARKRLSNEQIEHDLEIEYRKISKIINGGDVKLTLTQTMRLLRFAGLRLEGNHEPAK